MFSVLLVAISGIVVVLIVGVAWWDHVTSRRRFEAAQAERDRENKERWDQKRQQELHRRDERHLAKSASFDMYPSTGRLFSKPLTAPERPRVNQEQVDLYRQQVGRTKRDRVSEPMLDITTAGTDPDFVLPIAHGIFEDDPKPESGPVLSSGGGHFGGAGASDSWSDPTPDVSSTSDSSSDSSGSSD